MRPHSRGGRRWWWIGGGIALAAVVVAIGLKVVPPLVPEAVSAQEKVAPAAGFLPQEDPRRAQAAVAASLPAVAVSVSPATERPLQRFVEAVGTFSGFEEVTVMAEVSGRVVKIHHELGDTVRPGDLLLEIDPTDYQLAVDEAASSLVTDLARLGVELKDVPKDLDQIAQDPMVDRLIQAHPMIRRSIQQEENARRRRDRAEQLSQQNAIGQEDLEQLRTDYEVARNNRLEAQLDAQAIAASVRARAATLLTAQEKLRKTQVVVHPSDLAEAALGKGQVEYVVAKRNISEGEMVKDSPNASMAVFDLVIDKLLKLYGNVPERYIGQVQAGQKVEVRVEAYTDRVFEGKVSRVSPTVDQLSRTFQVEALVPNPTRELRPGGFARLDILTRVDPQAVTVPSESVVSFAGSVRVFVVAGGKAHAVPVRTGLSGRGWVEVLPAGEEKIEPGSQVVTTGQQQLAEGMPVRIRGAEAEKSTEF